MNNYEFYSRFHEQLKKSQSWPGKYMFKFILKSNHPDRNKLEDFFKKFKKKHLFVHHPNKIILV